MSIAQRSLLSGHYSVMEMRCCCQQHQDPSLWGMVPAAAWPQTGGRGAADRPLLLGSAGKQHRVLLQTQRGMEGKGTGPRPRRAISITFTAHGQAETRPQTHHGPLGLPRGTRLWGWLLGRLGRWWGWGWLWRGHRLRVLGWGLRWLRTLCRRRRLGHWWHLRCRLEGGGLLQLVGSVVGHLLLPLRVQVQDLVADV